MKNVTIKTLLLSVIIAKYPIFLFAKNKVNHRRFYSYSLVLILY